MTDAAIKKLKAEASARRKLEASEASKDPEGKCALLF